VNSTPSPSTRSVAPEDGPRQISHHASDFFAHRREPSPEIIEGIARAQQIAAIGGAYGVGKSPWLQELLVCRVYGLPWCGRTVLQGPAALLDFENPAWTIRRNIECVCERRGVSLPGVPEGLEIVPEIDDPARNPATAELLLALKSGKIDDKLAILEDILGRQPNSLIVIDPPEMLFPINTRERVSVQWLYSQYRFLLSKYPGALFMNTFNLRKIDKRFKRSNLFADPRGWLEEISGSLDLLNRSDVRLGMDFHEPEDVRVVNGIRRGEDLHPMLIRPVHLDDDPDKAAGCELVRADELEVFGALKGKLNQYWCTLPIEFTFEEATRRMGKSNFDRLKKRTTSLGALEQVTRGVYRKIRQGVSE
jgi:hypothetical protein